MLRWPAVAGIIYGIAIYTIMNLVVLPLSAAPKRQVTKLGVIIQLIIHMLFVGLPIALSASWAMTNVPERTKVSTQPLGSNARKIMDEYFSSEKS